MSKKRAANPKSGRPAKKTTDLLPRGYDELLRQLKERIRSAQLRAGLAVNRELIELYWQIGRSSSASALTAGESQSSSDWPRTSRPNSRV